MTFPLWSTLTADQQQTLLTSVRPSIGVGIELLPFDFDPTQSGTDLSKYLQRDDQGGVQWDGSQPVPRQVTLTLAYELPWGTAMVRVYRTIYDSVSGLSARVNRGVFCLTTPDQAIGQTALVDGVRRKIYSVTGSDRSTLLDRLAGYSVVAPMLDDNAQTLPVLTDLAELYAESGVPVFFINSVASASLMPDDSVWPILPTGSDDTSSTDHQVTAGVDPTITANADNGNAATWRQMINDLHSLVSYRAVWCDEAGALQSGPYADPAVQATTVTIDAAVPGTMAIDRTVSADSWGVPNVWICEWSNMTDANGDEVTAVPNEANDGSTGVLVLRNDDQGLSSIQARNNLEYPQSFSFTAATLDDFLAQCYAQKARDLRTVTTYRFNLHPVYCAVLGHFTVALLKDPQIEGGSAKVQITSWGPESFTNGDIPVTAVSV